MLWVLLAIDLQILYECNPKVSSLSKYTHKMCIHPTPLHPMVVLVPYAKCGIDFLQCKPISSGSHNYVIVDMYHFTKWVEVMHTYSNDSATTAIIFFNHIITRFCVPKDIMTNHGSHFRNHMVTKLLTRLGFYHENSSPRYHQANS